MKDMKLSPEKAKEMVTPIASDGPRYPYGLCLRLGEDELKKLGIKELPDVGSKMMIRAVVEVQSVGQYESQQSESRNLELQIVEMDLKKAKKEIDPDKFYDKK